jgi:hypothetical protein
MGKRKRTEGQTIIYKILQYTLKDWARARLEVRGELMCSGRVIVLETKRWYRQSFLWFGDFDIHQSNDIQTIMHSVLIVSVMQWTQNIQ